MRCHGRIDGGLRLSGLLLAVLAIPVVCPSSAHGMYDPKHGRWLQRDPLGLTVSVTGRIVPWKQYLDGLHLYQYVGARPVIVTDPMGMKGSCNAFKPPDMPCFCCCVKDLRGPLNKVTVNGTVGGTSGKNQRGHEFDVFADLSYVRHDAGPKNRWGDCTLQWWEWGDGPMGSGDREKEWIDQFEQKRGNDVFKDWWAHMDRRLGDEKSIRYYWPTADPVRLSDPAVIRLQRDFSRTLYFGIKVGNAPGCPCPSAAKERKLIMKQWFDTTSTEDPTLEVLTDFPSPPGPPPGW